MLPSDLEQVRALWRELTDAPRGFRENGLVVIGSDTHRAAPTGWIGIVALGGDVVVACPVAAAERVREQLAGSSPDQIVDPLHVDPMLHPIDSLGPALLFYGRPRELTRSTRLTRSTQVIGPLHATDPLVLAVVEDATPSERGEAGLEHVTSSAYVGLADDDSPASVSAWTEWPQRIAHMSSLTAASYRGKGYGLATANAALGAADAHGLLPQWRAAQWNHASIALARSLGLSLIGQQYSVALP